MWKDAAFLRERRDCPSTGGVGKTGGLYTGSHFEPIFPQGKFPHSTKSGGNWVTLGRCMTTPPSRLRRATSPCTGEALAGARTLSSLRTAYPSLPSSMKARSFRRSSSPNRTRFAGLRFGLGRIIVAARNGSDASFYHSIFSTGMGFSFTTILSTRPFFTWITLSAMGAMAVLWVMTTTVIPSLRQVSCSSLRMDLPVT